MATVFRAVIKIERLDGQRELISTTVLASTPEALKRKVAGLIDLMEPDDLKTEGDK